VVVDYACPDSAGDWVESQHAGVRVLRVRERSVLNRSEARNLGARATAAPWLCFVDADVRVDRAFSRELEARLAPGVFLVGEPIREGTEGTFCCGRADFERVGGYDEAYEGWGEEDNDLYDALVAGGLRRGSFPSSLLAHLPHGDAERGRFHALEPRLSHAVNRVYRILKWDCLKLRGRPMDLATRRALHARVREVVLAHQAGRGGDPLRVPLPAGIVPGGPPLERVLEYRLLG
jgi:hypothetical protein